MVVKSRKLTSTLTPGTMGTSALEPSRLDRRTSPREQRPPLAAHLTLARTEADREAVRQIQLQKVHNLAHKVGRGAQRPQHREQIRPGDGVVRHHPHLTPTSQTAASDATTLSARHPVRFLCTPRAPPWCGGCSRSFGSAGGGPGRADGRTRPRSDQSTRSPSASVVAAAAGWVGTRSNVRAGPQRCPSRPSRLPGPHPPAPPSAGGHRMRRRCARATRHRRRLPRLPAQTERRGTRRPRRCRHRRPARRWRAPAGPSRPRWLRASCCPR